MNNGAIDWQCNPVQGSAVLSDSFISSCLVDAPSLSRFAAIHQRNSAYRGLLWPSHFRFFTLSYPLLASFLCLKQLRVVHLGCLHPGLCRLARPSDASLPLAAALYSCQQALTISIRLCLEPGATYRVPDASSPDRLSRFPSLLFSSLSFPSIVARGMSKQPN